MLGLGLLIATLASRVRYESIIKAAVFLPQAIAATALAVIWKFVYAPDSNIGLLNAVLGVGNVGPISFLGDPNIVNWALIAVGTWASVGFATVILSAALKGIPAEIIEAARTDGANERQIFFRIILPMVSLPLSVLAVTLIVNVVKLFDLIYVMTNGGPGTSSRVIGYTFYVEGFQAGLFGKAAAVAVVMMRHPDPDHDLQHPALPIGVRGMSEQDALAGPAIRPAATTTSGRIVRALNRTPIHIVLALVALIWLAPTIGLLVTSFRPRTDIQATGWWETLSTLRFTTENYEQVLGAQGMGQAFINNMIIADPGDAAAR